MCPKSYRSQDSSRSNVSESESKDSVVIISNPFFYVQMGSVHFEFSIFY